jgi:hypothetical protein
MSPGRAPRHGVDQGSDPFGGLGFDAYDPNLVEVHISELRRKLDQHGPRLLHTLRGLGYVLRDGQP